MTCSSNPLTFQSAWIFKKPTKVAYLVCLLMAGRQLEEQEEQACSLPQSPREGHLRILLQRTEFQAGNLRFECKQRAKTAPTFFHVLYDWIGWFLIKYISIWSPFFPFFRCFPIENSTNKSTKSTSCFIFLFGFSKITKLMTKKLKKATLGISREIWCSNRETGRFDEKLGDSRENRESWQVWTYMCRYLHTYIITYMDL